MRAPVLTHVFQLTEPEARVGPDEHTLDFESRKHSRISNQSWRAIVAYNHLGGVSSGRLARWVVGGKGTLTTVAKSAMDVALHGISRDAWPDTRTSFLLPYQTLRLRLSAQERFGSRRHRCSGGAFFFLRLCGFEQPFRGGLVEALAGVLDEPKLLPVVHQSSPCRTG